MLIGSEDKPEERPNKLKDLKDPKQIGFGESEKLNANVKTEKNIDKDILNAMKKAQIKASKFSFKPDNQKGQGINKKAKPKKYNFTFI